MNQLFEKIYFSSPVVIQNFLISLYGLKLVRERYTGHHKKHLKKLLDSQWYSSCKIDTLVNEKFLDIFRYSVENVPYYKDLIQHGIISLKEIKTINDITKIPILKKEQIREHPKRFLSQKIPENKIIIINTSGTTGKTLKIFIDYDSRRYNYAFFSRFKKWAGVTSKLPNITLAGRTIVPQNQSNPPFWRRNILMNNYLFSSYHLNPENLPYYVDKMLEIQPHFIDSYPSAIYCIAKYIQENNITGILPKAIITSAETLFYFQRKVIEDVFKCRVFDQYGSAEQVVFISQCEERKYHINPEFGYVEFLREDGSNAEPGEKARLVCTGFTNRAMPLIRYDIGDIGVLSQEQTCPCGRSFPVVERIIGRTDDVLLMRDGRQVGRLDPVFKGLNSIKEAQIIQEDFDNIRLLIVPGKNYDNNEADIIVYELKKRLGNQAKISVEIVSEIKRTKAGKFRGVISKVKIIKNCRTDNSYDRK